MAKIEHPQQTVLLRSQSWEKEDSKLANSIRRLLREGKLKGEPSSAPKKNMPPIPIQPIDINNIKIEAIYYTKETSPEALQAIRELAKSTIPMLFKCAPPPVLLRNN